MEFSALRAELRPTISHSLLLFESHTHNKQMNQALLLPEGSVKLKSAVRGLLKEAGKYGNGLQKEHPWNLNLEAKKDYSLVVCLLSQQRSANTELFKGGLKKAHRKVEFVMNTKTVQAALFFNKKAKIIKKLKKTPRSGGNI